MEIFWVDVAFRGDCTRIRLRSSFAVCGRLGGYRAGTWWVVYAYLTAKCKIFLSNRELDELRATRGKHVRDDNRALIRYVVATCLLSRFEAFFGLSLFWLEIVSSLRTSFCCSCLTCLVLLFVSSALLVSESTCFCALTTSIAGVWSVWYCCDVLEDRLVLFIFMVVF